MKKGNKHLLSVLSIISTLSFVAYPFAAFAQQNKFELPAKLVKIKSSIGTQKVKNNKIGPMLNSIISTSPNNKNSIGLSPLVKTKSGVMHQVYVKVSFIDDVDLEELKELGLEVEIVNSQIKKIQGWASKQDINAIAELSNVISITTPNYASNRAGSAQTEGDEILRANLLRDRGFTGQGVKVGIVSDGSNALSTSQASGDLPAQIAQFGICPSATRGTTCNEGTAMAEIIHDIAPDAELAIGAVSTSLEFIQRINQLANTFKADIIVDDLGFFAEPYFEDGDIAQAVTALPSRVLYVSSAGNSARTHYEAQFRSISTSLGNDLHDFGSAVGSPSQEALGFIVPPRTTSCVLLQWNEPFSNTSSDYDLVLIDQNGITVDSSLSGGPFAIEAACSTNNSSQAIVNFAIVNRFSGATRQIKMFVLNTGEIQFPVPRGSIFGHPATERAIAVGTINADEPGNDQIAGFSSQGPSQIYFPSIVNRQKPDITGIDGVSVTGAGGFPSTFFGTSAAAPHVAAVAAQLKSARNIVTTRSLRKALIGGAADLGSSGSDRIYGFGLVDAVTSESILIGGLPLPPFSLLLDDD